MAAQATKSSNKTSQQAVKKRHKPAAPRISKALWDQITTEAKTLLESKDPALEPLILGFNPQLLTSLLTSATGFAVLVYAGNILHKAMLHNAHHEALYTLEGMLQDIAELNQYTGDPRYICNNWLRSVFTTFHLADLEARVHSHWSIAQANTQVDGLLLPVYRLDQCVGAISITQMSSWLAKLDTEARMNLTVPVDQIVKNTILAYERHHDARVPPALEQRLIAYAENNLYASVFFHRIHGLDVQHKCIRDATYSLCALGPAPLRETWRSHLPAREQGGTARQAIIMTLPGHEGA
jgi:hypothetical protein